MTSDTRKMLPGFVSHKILGGAPCRPDGDNSEPDICDDANADQDTGAPTARHAPPANTAPTTAAMQPLDLVLACVTVTRRDGDTEGNAGNSPASKPTAPRRMPAYFDQLRGLADTHMLARYIARYLGEEVRGLQSPNTFEAKGRDLTAFAAWFVDFNGHGRITDWQRQDTAAYLAMLEHEQGRAPATVNRVLASLRHFAKWCHEQPAHVFEAGGIPTRGVKELDIDEADCKKLTPKEVHQMFKAADTLVRSRAAGSKRPRPRRNRAILAVLYYTGLRVSELVALKRAQYQGNYLLNVARKGKSRSKGLYLVAECRRHLDRYLETERLIDDPDAVCAPLFLSNAAGRFMTRRLVYHVLEVIAEQASLGREADEGIAMHPHRLRHTFGAEFRERTGSDTETAAALGHTGLAYVGRYARRSNDEREAALEEIFAR
jgi:integrase/recombinase XerD